MAQSTDRDALLAPAVTVDDQGVLHLQLPSSAAFRTADVVARRRSDGAEERASTDTEGRYRLRLPLVADEWGRWDLHVEAIGPDGTVLTRLPHPSDGAHPEGRVVGDTVVEVYRTVKDNLSVQVRARRPRAYVTDVEAAGDILTVRGHLTEAVGEVRELALVGVSRHNDRVVCVAAERTQDGGFQAQLALGQLITVLGLRHNAIDLSLRVTGTDGSDTDLRLQRPRDEGPRRSFPILQVPDGGDDIDVQPYWTVRSNLSVRLGAGSPPGVGTLPGAVPRRPAPPALRRLVDLYLSGIEQRNGARRAGGRPSVGTERPRVYFLLRSAYGMGGTIRTVVNTANHLAGLGYRVELISLLRPKETMFFSLHPKIRHTALFEERSRSGGEVTIATSGKRLRALTQRHLWHWLDQFESVLTHPREVAFGRSSLLTDILLVRKLQRLKPGVLVLTRPVLNVVGARYAPPDVRTVGQEHMNFSLHAPEMRAWMLDAYPRLDVLTVLTQGDEDDYREALADTDVEVRKVPNGLPSLPERISDQKAKVVVAAGRLTRQKGFDLLVPAFAQVAAVRPDWELRIFGDGPDQNALQAQIRDLGVVDSVRLMGRTGQMDTELADASLYVLSSRFEGFGMVIIEAMSVGLPVVAFDCPRGPGDIITDGKDGFLVPPEDVDGLARALLKLMDDDELRQSMASAARTTAQQYSMDELGTLWRDMLRELGTTPRPPAPPEAASDSRRGP